MGAVEDRRSARRPATSFSIRQRKSWASSSSVGASNAFASHPARVEEPHRVLEHAALAGGVHPLEHQQHAAVAAGVGVGRQLRLQLRDLVVELLRVAALPAALSPSNPGFAVAGRPASRSTGPGRCGAARRCQGSRCACRSVRHSGRLPAACGLDRRSCRRHGPARHAARPPDARQVRQGRARPGEVRRRRAPRAALRAEVGRLPLPSSSRTATRSSWPAATPSR